MAQEAHVGNLQYFLTEVVLDMGTSRRCWTLPMNPSFAFQYVRRNGCWGYLYCRGDTEAELCSLRRLGGEGPSVHPPVTFSISSPLEILGLIKKSVWKQWLSVKISLQYASIASEIPLSIPSRLQSVARHTVIIFFWELPLSNWSLFHLLMWANSHINIWISSKSHNLTVRPPNGDLFLFWWF